MWRSGDKAIWWDESLSLLRAQSSWRDILINRIHISGADTTDQHPPAYFALLHIVTLVAGQSDTALRFPSACFAAALIPLLYVVGKHLRNQATGLLAAAGGALSPFLLWYAQEARMYTLVTWLGLLSIYLLWQALVRLKWYLFVVYGITLTLGLLTQYLFILLLPSHLLVAAALVPGRKLFMSRKRWKLYLGIAAIILPMAVVGLVSAMVIQRIPELGSNRTFVPLWMLVRDGFNSFSLGLSVVYEQIWYLDLVFWALYTAGIAVLTYEQIRLKNVSLLIIQLALLVGYIFIPMVLMWLFSFIAPLYMGSRYLLMCLSAFVLSVAVGLDVLWHRSRLVSVVVICVLLAATTYSLIRYFTVDYYANKEDYRSAARLIAANESGADVIVLNGSEIEAQFKHYYEGHLPIVPFPLVDYTQEDIESGLQNLAAQFDRIWLIEGNKEITDPDERVKAWFRDNALLLGENIFGGYVQPLSLSSYYPGPIAIPVTGGASGMGTFNGMLRVDALSFRYIDTHNESVRMETTVPAGVSSIPAGRAVGILITSTVQSHLPILKGSLRILDNQGRLVAQKDAEPLYYFKTNQWPVAHQVSFQLGIRIPPGTPPGDYQFALLVYREDDLQPLPFTFTGETEEHNMLNLGTLQVVEGSPFSYEVSVVPEGYTQLQLPVRYGPLELRGYHIPEEAQAGSDVTMPLFWATTGEVANDVELVVNWRDGNKQIWHTSYLALDTMGRQMSAWPADVLRNTLNTLHVPVDAPRGESELYLMVRQRGTNTYFPVYRSGIPMFRNAFRLGTITIK